MRMRLVAASIAGCFFIAAPTGGEAAQSGTGQDLTPEGRGAYLAVAGAVDLYEIRSGELAREKARRSEVRRFAERMISDHRRSTQRLLDAARASGLEALPPAMMPMHWDMLRRLEAASGSRFDRRYVAQQVEAHEMALELHRSFAENGTDSNMQSVAEDAALMVEQHLAQARPLLH